MHSSTKSGDAEPTHAARPRTGRPGGCACGAVRYSVEGDPLFVHACHCTDCQRRAGGAFGLSMMLEAGQLAIVRGEPARYDQATPQGGSKLIHYCARCGVMIFGVSPDEPGVIWLRPGTLDDTRNVLPQAQIWVRSKQPWVVLPEDQPRFETGYDREAVWPAESLARLEAAKG